MVCCFAMVYSFCIAEYFFIDSAVALSKNANDFFGGDLNEITDNKSKKHTIELGTRGTI